MARRQVGVRERLERQLDALGESIDGLEGLSENELLAKEVLVVSDAASRAATGASVTVNRDCLAGAVRTTLGRLASNHPGHLVEVRVPPWAAVQVGIPGVASIHRRGTPPNVVETDALTWLRLASGTLTWDAALASHLVSASGAHAQLGDLLPLA